MHILSNGFPTNLPNSEHVSQGGPAHFAKLFTSYILSGNMVHQWTGVMLDATRSSSTRLHKVFSVPRRSYYRLRVPRALLRAVIRAERADTNPALVWQKPIRRLAKLIRQRRPDVVFLNGFGVFNWMLLRAAHQASTPVVVQHAGIWTKELNIHKNNCSGTGRKLMEFMEQESTQLATEEVFLNQWSKNYYRSFVAAGDETRTSIIPLPFNFAGFRQLGIDSRPSAFVFDKEHFHIGAIARWDKIKNHDSILAMAKRAHQKKLPWKFHSVVEIPDTKAYGNEKRAYQRYVDIIPPLDRSGIADFCRSVDMLVLPSLFDVSPTVVLEAIASDTPIVISPTVGYVHDFLAHGGAAWVVDPSDTNRALRQIAQLADKKMPVALKKTLLSVHDHRKVFAAYLNMFTRVSVGQTRA